MTNETMLRAAEMVDDLRARRVPLSVVDDAVIAVFLNNAQYALPVSAVHREQYFAETHFPEENLQTACTYLVRQKLLRSRLIAGVRHYEFAFSEAR